MGFDVAEGVYDTELTEDALKRMGKIDAGLHHAKLVEVNNHTTGEGNLAKRMKFEIIGGTFVGRKVQTDLFLTDSDGAKSRQHLFLCRLGAKVKDASGKYVPNPNVTGWEDLIGTEVIIDVVYPIRKDRGNTPSDFPDVAFQGLYALNDPKCAKVPRAGGAMPPAAPTHTAPPAASGHPAGNGAPAKDPYAGM